MLPPRPGIMCRAAERGPSAKDLPRCVEAEMFEGYPATFSAFTVIGGNEMDLEKIYRDRPELMRISPDVGYVYSEFAHKRTIARYFK